MAIGEVWRLKEYMSKKGLSGFCHGKLVEVKASSRKRRSQGRGRFEGREESRSLILDIYV